MLIDKELEFSDGQAVTAAAASTNVVDLGQTVDVAPGYPLQVRAQVDVALNPTTSMTFALQTDTVENFASPTVLNSVTVLTADLVAGKQIDLGRIPSTTQRYLRLYYTPNGGNASAGSVSAFVEVYQAPEGDITDIPGNL